MWFPLQSLLLLHYLIRNGSERVVTNAREHVYDMKPLEEYTCRDDHGRDQGVNGECRICEMKESHEEVGSCEVVVLYSPLLGGYWGCGFLCAVF